MVYKTDKPIKQWFRREPEEIISDAKHHKRVHEIKIPRLGCQFLNTESGLQ